MFSLSRLSNTIIVVVAIVAVAWDLKSGETVRWTFAAYLVVASVLATVTIRGFQVYHNSMRGLLGQLDLNMEQLKAVDQFLIGEKRAQLNMPQGSGKTYLAHVLAVCYAMAHPNSNVFLPHCSVVFLKSIHVKLGGKNFYTHDGYVEVDDSVIATKTPSPMCDLAIIDSMDDKEVTKWKELKARVVVM